MRTGSLVLAVVLGSCCAAGELPLLVGGHAHGAKNIEMLADLGLGNFVWVPKKDYSMGNTPWDAEHDIMAKIAVAAITSAGA